MDEKNRILLRHSLCGFCEKNGIGLQRFTDLYFDKKIIPGKLEIIDKYNNVYA